MKFATAKEHRDFFQKEGWIEFERMISDEQLELLNKAIDHTLADRLNTTSDKFSSVSSERFFMQSRDLWRSNPHLFKLICQTRLTETVNALIEKKPFRLGYDQLFPSWNAHPFSKKDSSFYSDFLEKNSALETVSCLTDLACGVLVALNSGGEMREIQSRDKLNIFSKHSGNIVFFKPNLIIDWKHLKSCTNQRFYLIVYTHPHSHYQLQTNDPHTHELKRIGYILNDKLSDKLHPIVYR